MLPPPVQRRAVSGLRLTILNSPSVGMVARLSVLAL